MPEAYFLPPYSIDRYQVRIIRTSLSYDYDTLMYLDVIHIAIVCGKRDLLELRIGSIRSLDLSDLICLSASQQGQYDESIWPAA